MPALAGAVQEGLIGLLLFQEAGNAVRTLVPVECFDYHYRFLAERAMVYWERFAAPPGEHTVDLVDALIAKHPKDAQVYRRLLKSLCQAREGLNAAFLLEQAARFVRQQRLRSGIMRAVECVQRDQLDEAEQALSQCMKAVLSTFAPGIRLNDPKQALEFLKGVKEPCFPTGIPELDWRGLGPVRKELHLFIALPKYGKTWWLVHLGRQALEHRFRVLHVTLEMSEEKICQRYIQNLCSISKVPGDQERAYFDRDELGRLVSSRLEPMKRRRSFKDDNIERFLEKKLREWQRRPPLYIKAFPTNQLTIAGLRTYLDGLWLSEKFTPDLLLLDYADLMKVEGGADAYRFSLGQLYKDLRGLAVERNLAIATASQSNRVGTKSSRLTDANVAEDYSKVGTADTVITYNRTEAEKQFKMARLYVASARSDEDKFEIAISQNYAVGQFCLDSIRMSNRWGRILNALQEKRKDADQ